MERFWAKVVKTQACWLWRGSQTKGYGTFCPKHGTTVYAHRYAYQQLVGDIPDGLQIDHKCRITLCVNPAHLEPVTAAENLRRSRIATGYSIGKIMASKTHCKHGHEYTATNTIYYKAGTKYRQCRECKRISDRRYREKKN